MFGADSENEEIYALTCKPLLERALNGQVGVVFAYGQTGSGKTHTMNGLMDGLIDSELFSPATEVTFSYLEILGDDIGDCLEGVGGQAKPGVKIGEMLDGSIGTRGLSTKTCANPGELRALVEKAKASRSTAATSRNDTSSRSHGAGIITCKDLATGIEGKL